MKKIILIATNNTDKFEIIKNILSSVLDNCQFVSLKDFRINASVKESGDIIKRAAQKAEFYLAIVRNKNIDCDVVVGIDDGLFIPKFNFATEASKELTDKILSGKCIGVGDKVVIRRGICVLDCKTGSAKSDMFDIPFKFIGNKNDIKRKGNKYPLSYVLSPLGINTPVVALKKEDANNYYLKFASKIVEELFY